MLEKLYVIEKLISDWNCYVKQFTTMLVTRALSQDVMLLVFVPQPVSSVTLILKESPLQSP